MRNPTWSERGSPDARRVRRLVDRGKTPLFGVGWTYEPIDTRIGSCAWLS